MNIAHLKSKILDLAVRGKLTEQRPEEGSAEELLERIREEKQRLIAEGKMKKEKLLPEITEEEIPFDIPAGWKWVRLGEICEVISKGTTPQGGKSAFESSSGIKFLKVENILSDGTISHCGISYITESHHFGVLKRSILQKDDLLISIAGTLGKLAIVRDCDLPLNTNQAIAFVRFLDRKKICIKYIFYILSSNLLKTLLTSCSKVTAIPNLTLEILWNLHIPLPPLAEQKRIVEKIEAIFKQADIIEENRLALKTAVRHTKRRVLDLAVRGKLTEQWPEEGSAEELLERIREEKQRLIAEGKLKKEKPLPEITEEEISFDIPAGWKWVRLGEIGTWQAGCTPDTTRKDFYENGTIPWINSADLTDGYIDTITHYVTEKAFTEKKMRLNKTGAVCVAMYGATIGKTGILTVDATTNQAVCVCNLLSSMDSKYLFYFLQFHKPFFVMKGFGGAQPNISKEKIENTPFPLPPLAEQKRIVEKIEQIFDILDTIEKAVEG